MGIARRPGQLYTSGRREWLVIAWTHSCTSRFTHGSVQRRMHQYIFRSGRAGLVVELIFPFSFCLHLLQKEHTCTSPIYMYTSVCMSCTTACGKRDPHDTEQRIPFLHVKVAIRVTGTASRVFSHYPTSPNKEHTPAAQTETVYVVGDVGTRHAGLNNCWQVVRANGLH